jgi:hypothetical protein
MGVSLKKLDSAAAGNDRQIRRKWLQKAERLKVKSSDSGQ